MARTITAAQATAISTAALYTGEVPPSGTVTDGRFLVDGRPNTLAVLVRLGLVETVTEVVGIGREEITHHVLTKAGELVRQYLKAGGDLPTLDYVASAVARAEEQDAAEETTPVTLADALAWAELSGAEETDRAVDFYVQVYSSVSRYGAQTVAAYGANGEAAAIEHARSNIANGRKCWVSKRTIVWLKRGDKRAELLLSETLVGEDLSTWSLRQAAKVRRMQGVREEGSVMLVASYGWEDTAPEATPAKLGQEEGHNPLCGWPYRACVANCAHLEGWESHKYESPLAERLHALTMDSSQDAELGDTDTIGWFARFDHERAIIAVDDRGFVTAGTYTTPEALRISWEALEKEEVWSYVNALTIGDCNALFLIVDTARHNGTAPDLDEIRQHIDSHASCHEVNAGLLDV